MSERHRTMFDIPIARWVIVLLGQLTRAALFVAPPIVRIALALPFLRSGMTRWDGFLTLTPGTIYLFEEQFKLHLFGNAVDLPAPDQLAFLVAMAELVLPILLLAGLATRFAALGLLAMTCVIQLVVPDGWQNFHLYWAALALAAIALGPGALSLDRLAVTFGVCRGSSKPNHAR